VRVKRERQPKLDAEAGFALPDLGGKPLSSRTFTSTYFDAADRRLLRAGITLRRRVENRAGVWQLKLPADDGRFELEVRGGPGKPPSAFVDLLAASLRAGTVVEPVARMRTRREGVSVGTSVDRVEVVVDTVTVVGTRSGFVEIEAEVVAGDGSALPGIGQALRKAGASPARHTSKLARVLGEAGRPAEGDGDPVAKVRDGVVAQYEAILASDPGVRLGEDPEALHQLRVATRRSRAILRAARGLIAADWTEPLRAELKWLGGLLGPVRDLDVLLEHLDSAAASLEEEDARAYRRLRARLVAARHGARQTLLEGLRSERYFQLVDTLAGGADAPAGDLPTPLPEIACNAYGRLRKVVRALPGRPADEELHRVRIEVKRARYAAELASPDLGKRGARLIERAKVVQDLIGDHQDAVVAEQRLRELALRGGGKTGLVAGRLIERQRRRKRKARHAFPGAMRQLEKAARGAFR
jgi:CHAD domain-containing protein